MKNHFFFSYAGNKRNECEDIYNKFLNEKLKDEKITTIIEPYCGTSSISYYTSLKHPKKYNYILNDNNKQLIELYEMVKNGKYKKINDEMNKLIIEFNKYTDDIERKKYYELIKKNNDLYSYLFTNKYHSIHAGFYPQIKRLKEIKPFKIEEIPVYNFIVNEKITFLNLDALELINKYKNNENIILILDPPYVQSCNDFYSNQNMNIYEYLYNNNINDYKCEIVLILENMWINKLLFRTNKILLEYNKVYQGNKKKTTHIIITKN
jgi:hypothetical protein